MKFCQPCFEKLKKALADRGLHPTGVPETDPLMQATMNFYSYAIEAAGLALFVEDKEEAEVCPACYLVKHCPCGKPDCGFLAWDTQMADAALQHMTKAKA